MTTDSDREIAALKKKIENVEGTIEEVLAALDAHTAKTNNEEAGAAALLTQAGLYADGCSREELKSLLL